MQSQNVSEDEISRIYQHVSKQQQSHRLYQHSHCAESQPEFTFHPAISAQSAKLNRKIDDLYKWYQQVRNKREYKYNQEVRLGLLKALGERPEGEGEPLPSASSVGRQCVHPAVQFATEAAEEEGSEQVAGVSPAEASREARVAVSDEAVDGEEQAHPLRVPKRRVGEQVPHEAGAGGRDAQPPHADVPLQAQEPLQGLVHQVAALVPVTVHLQT